MSSSSSRQAASAPAGAGFRNPGPVRGGNLPGGHVCADPAAKHVPAAQSAAQAANISHVQNISCVHVRQAIVAPAVRAARGVGLSIAYGFHESPFGLALLLVNEGRNAGGLCGLAFAGHEAEKLAILTGMRSRWPKAAFREALQITAPYAEKVFSPSFPGPDEMIEAVFYGTEFELSVWQALLWIPLGVTASYSDIAREIGAPLAVRAVGAAISRNPLAYVAPCHRVLRKDGGLGGYRWGASRKQSMVKWELKRLQRLSEAAGSPI
jgi:AraC family transcriptional regulator, regulatory protein of adaptative response / methylated-DNA-[protein]-cysteine methyltransferase